MPTAGLLKIGARGSPLSLAQTGLTAGLLEAAHPGLLTEIVPIKTAGDRLLEAPLAKIGGKGLFVKEIEEALLSGAIDLAVHSAKDLPAELPAGLRLGATPERADFRDVLVARAPGGLTALPAGARVGTSGLRRQAQLLAARPDLAISGLRGNVGTRLKKLATDFEAIVLAAAGLARLKATGPNLTLLAPEVMLPAAGQGVLALETRVGDDRVLGLLAPLNHRPTALALAAERGFLRRLGSGCQSPVAALARLDKGRMTLEGLIASLDGREVVRGRKTASVAAPEAAAGLGSALALELLERGGRKIMTANEGI
ncbi:MAG: hydroxymethylbilane synthase [Candidatus Adiutrix sp.]|jgi:hydroxymethylbilane synthase|nr:hydroxymethylbilane synthase [Candidatus Adiutrix sp.]